MSISGLTTLVWAIIEAPSKGWTNPTILAAFAAAAAILGAFMAWELRTREPMLDIRLFANPRFSGASAAITLMFFAMFGSIFFLTQYLQGVLGYSALEAGAARHPDRARPDPRRSDLGEARRAARDQGRRRRRAHARRGRPVDRHAVRRSTRATASSPRTCSCSGFGMGMAMAPATESVMGSLPVEKASVGSAVNDTTRTTGGALGVAILGSLLASQYRGDMDEAVSGLPHDAAATASDTLSGGLAVAHRLGDSGLADAAQYGVRQRHARRRARRRRAWRWPARSSPYMVIPGARARGRAGRRAAPEPVPA